MTLKQKAILAAIEKVEIPQVLLNKLNNNKEIYPHLQTKEQIFTFIINDFENTPFDDEFEFCDICENLFVEYKKHLEKQGDNYHYLNDFENFVDYFDALPNY